MSAIRGRFAIPPVGTIYWSPVGRAWKVVKCAEKTLWLQEIKVDRSRIGPPTLDCSTKIGDVIMRRIDNKGLIRPDANTRPSLTMNIVYKPE